LGPGWTQFESINEVYDLAFGPDDRLWAVTSGGLVAWDLTNETYVRYELRAYHLAVAPDGALWLTTEAGLCHFDGERCEYAPAAPGMGDEGLYDPVVAPDGTVWIGNQTGIWRFDGEIWTEAGLVGMASDLAIGAAGDVWAATGAGVARSQRGPNPWQTYGQAEGLPDGQAVAIGVSQSEAWAAIAWDGVYRLDGERWVPVENPPGGIVRAIEVAADDTVWVGTVGSLHYPGGSLSYWDGERWVDVSSQAGLISLRAIAHGPKGVVAAATQRGLGLYEGGKWRLLRDGPASRRVTSVAVTPDGAAWFAFGDQSASTVGNGLSHFGGEEWAYFLDDAEVGALAVAPDGALWAGSGCKVQRYDGSQWEVVGRCEGEIPMGNVVDIEFTSDGKAWVATGLGLAHYDGLGWTDYDRLANHLVAGPDGTLWVDGWEGSQGSWYLAHVQGEAWTSYRLADAYPGGFRLGAVTADGRLWGMVEGQGLASFDGSDWGAASSWAFYPAPDPSPAPSSVLGASDEGALWLATDEGVARFVPPGEGESDGTWTHFPVDDARGRFAANSLAVGPDGEMWFNNTRLIVSGND
jgi:ligand-binding sensor domain-containing protein